MFSIEEAIHIAKESYPAGDIFSWIEWNDLYLFKMFNNLPGEEQMDPFFSVNKETGEFKEFGILTDGDTLEIIDLFVEKESQSG